MARTTTSPELMPNPNVEAVVFTQALGITPRRSLHSQGRITSPDCMVLVRQGRTEQSHDAIAHHLIDCALIPMHRLHHDFEDGIEDLSRFFRIAIRQQFHGTLEIGKEHRDQFAVTLKRALRRENLVGEVREGPPQGGPFRVLCGLVYRR